MTKSKKEDIIARVKWIHKNRAEVEKLESDKKTIESRIQGLVSETSDKLELLKRDMGENTDLNIKIDGRYYALTKHTIGVDIDEFFLNIEEE